MATVNAPPRAGLACELQLKLTLLQGKSPVARTRVSDADLRAYLAVGHSQADAARHFGVSEPAIHQRLKRLRVLTSRVVAMEQAGQVVEEKLSASARLEGVQEVIDDELAWAVKQARQDGADRAALVDTILKLTGEVRHQLGLQLDISRTLVDLRVVKEFQETVIGAIREESPATAHRIVARLKERRALRPSATLPSLVGGASDGSLE
jgi:DNA-binding transcriptional regulator YdaS (Cro superfamily)